MARRIHEENVFRGFPASSGIVIGKAFVIDRHHLCVLENTIPENEIEEEIERFQDAVERAQSAMTELRDNAEETFGTDIPASIFDAHNQIMRDPSLLAEVEAIIEERRCNAEWALTILLERYRIKFSSIRKSYFRERLVDIEQAVTELQRQLIQDEEVTLAHLTEPVILISHDLTPADTLQMDREKVIGFAIDVGGRTSHAGIIASSMDIPAVVGLKNLSIRLKTGDLVIVDGNSGDVVLRPTGDQFQKYNRRRQKFLYFDETVHAQKDLKAATKDGIEVRVMANIESSGDLPHLAEHGAEGVGLYRTEFLYLNRNEWPDEEEQFQDYKKVAQVVAPHYAVIRTLDIGGDKISPSKSFSEVEPNPAMGLRAIRYCLKHPKIFKTQLKAILRASHYGKLKIMYPLITTVEELLAANALLEECKKQLAENEIPFDSDIEVGIMIETPSSVMLADILARHCSFFSIGTNDLIQYTMAIDRINEQVAYLYEPLSPAIVRMLSVAINAATKAGIGISVCGKMAGDPAYALLLLGMGQTINLSMDVHSIPRIKKFIRSISIAEAKQVGVEALAANDTEELKGLIAARLTLAAAEGITSALVGNVD